MKKIIIAVMLLTLFYKNVNAETFYGDYYKVDSIEEENDLTKKETYKLYNTYKIEYQDMGYLEDNDTYIKNEKDFIIEETLSDKIDNYEEIIIINTTFKTQRRIYFKNFSRHLKIYEVEIYYDDELINYTPGYPTEFPQPELSKLNDNNYETYYENTSNNDSYYMAFDLKKKYDLDKLKFIFYTKQNDNMNLSISLENVKPIVLNNEVDRKHIMVFNVLDTIPENNVEYLYTNKKILYKYYKELKIPTYNYVETGNNIIIDDYIEKNEYYKRNKLVLKDDITINSKTDNIKNYIEYASTQPIINCNINYDINGTYDCKFILEGLEVIKKVNLNIIKEYIKIEENNYEEKKIKEENNEINVENNTNVTKNIEDIEIAEDIKKEEEKDINNDEILLTENIIKKENLIQVKHQEKSSETVIKEEIKKDKKSTPKKTTFNKKTKEEMKRTTKKVNITTTISQKKEKKIEPQNKTLKISVFIILIFFNIFYIIKRKRNNVESI